MSAKMIRPKSWAEREWDRMQRRLEIERIVARFIAFGVCAVGIAAVALSVVWSVKAARNAVSVAREATDASLAEIGGRP